MNNAHRQAQRSGRLGRIARLTRKELRETLRDRRTVITLVLMPLLVYPLISISFNKSVLVTRGTGLKIVYSIGVEFDTGRGSPAGTAGSGQPAVAGPASE